MLVLIVVIVMNAVMTLSYPIETTNYRTGYLERYTVSS
jgi:hypothetical protein